MNQKEKTQKFKKIIQENRGVLFKVINIYCKDEQDKKDLEQEILIQLWKSVDNYDERFKISTWIYRIAMNVSISFYRKNKRAASHVSMDSIFMEQTLAESEDDVLEKWQTVKYFLNQLNELDKAIMLLYLDDFNYSDIGEIVGISTTNVGTKINRIKNKLKQNVTKWI
ncbi:RNA polymerase sigma factor [Robertkochia aurantiaca]|uniref:RNA polymerase sigma factor n=1 Tax=Robertkochia aurantiaca TaxID=2873700 RepID=UPI001CCC46E2|nr:RNA polymerase sigma factor [Robertkochia sp. 3YJGBD-33]